MGVAPRRFATVGFARWCIITGKVHLAPLPALR